jgi:phosphoglycerate dehydrogenase-like enzyme
MADKIVALVDGADDALWERLREFSDRLEVVTPARLKDDPGLWPRLEIAYGGLGGGDFARATGLRWFQTAAAGVNGLITPAMRQRGLVITNARGVGAAPITEHMFGMLLLVTRRLAQAWDRQKTREWDGDGLGDRVGLLWGRTLGVLGVGAIGGHSARVGRAFGMRVIGLRRGGGAHPDVERMYTPDTRREFLAACDVVLNTLPLTDATRGFLGAEELAACRPGAILVNTGRGGTVDTDALVAALGSGHLGAACLDVTDPEPLPPDHPLWAAPNVYLTPHYSGSRPDYAAQADAIFLDNLRRYLAGEPPVNVVDKAEGY